MEIKDNKLNSNDENTLKSKSNYTLVTVKNNEDFKTELQNNIDQYK